MPLKPEEQEELRADMERGHLASDAVPFLRKLAQQGRIEDIPEAVTFASGSMEVNQEMGRTFLAHRVPAVLINNSFIGLSAREYHGLIEETLEDSTWADRIVDAVAGGDGAELRSVVDSIAARGKARAGDHE
ncbi:MAG: hypothetical protein JXB39_16700 [Deltaproteobacteria bacterium]|nr:hypothetical protein [Deltaproteobacteria bacterium]